MSIRATAWSVSGVADCWSWGQSASPRSMKSSSPGRTTRLACRPKCTIHWNAVTGTASTVARVTSRIPILTCFKCVIRSTAKQSQSYSAAMSSYPNRQTHWPVLCGNCADLSSRASRTLPSEPTVSAHATASRCAGVPTTSSISNALLCSSNWTRRMCAAIWTSGVSACNLTVSLGKDLSNTTRWMTFWCFVARPLKMLRLWFAKLWVGCKYSIQVVLHGHHAIMHTLGCGLVKAFPPDISLKEHYNCTAALVPWKGQCRQSPRGAITVVKIIHRTCLSVSITSWYSSPCLVISLKKRYCPLPPASARVIT